jgi:hypothetical protein
MGSAFRERGWTARLTELGDEAEGKFGEYMEEIGLGFARFGLDRPPVQVHRLSDFVRYTPDFVTSTQLVEVQGHGREGITKCKLTKLAALLDWTNLGGMEVSMFLWNSHRQVRFMIPFYAYNDAMCDRKARTQGAFDDGRNPWFGVPDTYFDEYQV